MHPNILLAALTRLVFEYFRFDFALGGERVVHQRHQHWHNSFRDLLLYQLPLFGLLSLFNRLIGLLRFFGG